MILAFSWASFGWFVLGWLVGLTAAIFMLALCMANQKGPEYGEYFERWRFRTLWVDPIVEDEHNGYLVVKRSADGIILDFENEQGEILATGALDIAALGEMVH